MAPSHQPSYHGLAETMMAQGRSEEAASLLTTWAGTQPYVAESHVELAWLQREMGQTDAAAQSLAACTSGEPRSPNGTGSSGTVLRRERSPGSGSRRLSAITAIRLESARSSFPTLPPHHKMQDRQAQCPQPRWPAAYIPTAYLRQQTAFGPPSHGAQMAQMQMSQTQMAMGGNPMYSGQMAAAPNMNQSMMSAYYSPSDMQSSGNTSMSGGWQSANSIMNVPPDQTTSMSFGTGTSGTGMPEMQSPGQEWSFETTTPGATPSDVPLSPTPNTAVAPTPDPAFSATEPSTRVTNVSWSASTTKTPISGNTASEPPLVEAF